MSRYFPRASGPLTHAEIKPLAIEAKRAFDIQKENDLLEPGETFDTWRRAQVLEATDGRAAGLSKACHGQWRAILQHFLALQGRDIESYQMGMRTGAAAIPQATPTETIEDREQAAHVLAETLEQTRYRQPYAEAIAYGKFGTRDLGRLSAPQLMALVFTLRNRANARDGKGRTANRNKSQRLTPKKAPDEKPRTKTQTLPPGLMNPWVSAR